MVDRHLIQRLMARRRPDDPLARLSPHERRVLTLLAEGLSNLGIAERMSCRVGTVEKHLSAITGKLDLIPADPDARRGINVRVRAALAFLGGADGP
ncbi:helix-turn-helix transcriptional regulator [Micromonospora sp. WMMA1363]|uniref:helix-turn-helix domain-containing protein n=1 Tax=Micromonospora sp. WMMA1363 TaxID=3053985 RepID=UPI00259C8B07|nr:helix-turn-helix transcriptional regulator [Micromonospora sp. WMMA1363]MDM4720743.1 helix-turn-helix transcriptional regulator [Micromonospora sp. WMMA1363]